MEKDNFCSLCYTKSGKPCEAMGFVIDQTKPEGRIGDPNGQLKHLKRLKGVFERNSAECRDPGKLRNAISRLDECISDLQSRTGGKDRR